jgi:hypothetical protein
MMLVSGILKQQFMIMKDILLHFLVDASAVLLMNSVSMAALEAIVSAMAVAVGASAVMLAKKL